MATSTTHRLCGRSFKTGFAKRCTRKEAMERVEINIENARRRGWTMRNGGLLIGDNYLSP